MALAVGKLITLEPLVPEPTTLLAVAPMRVSKIQIDMAQVEVDEAENVTGPVVGGWMNPV